MIEWCWEIVTAFAQECAKSWQEKRSDSMKIKQDMRDYAAKQDLGDMNEATTKGMEDKVKEFVEQGGEVYRKA